MAVVFESPAGHPRGSWPAEHGFAGSDAIRHHDMDAVADAYDALLEG